MNDIVKRLRDHDDPKRMVTRLEAAAEIERLRAENAELVAATRNLLETCGEDPFESWDLVDKARAAIAKAEGK